MYQILFVISFVLLLVDADIPRTETDPMTYMPDTLPHVFVPNPATPDEVEQLINSFKEKPCNTNTIPIFIFKKLSTIIAPVICNVFNSAIAEGTFPSILKIARVILLHKAKSRKVKNNYRPISLLPFISKLIEKLIKIRACKIIDDQSILYSNQFGFRLVTAQQTLYCI